MREQMEQLQSEQEQLQDTAPHSSAYFNAIFFFDTHHHTLQHTNAGVEADARASRAVAERARAAAQGCQQQGQTLRWVKREVHRPL